MVAASVGDVDEYNNVRVWIARYSNGDWYTSLNFNGVYPNLAAYLNERGQNNLALCSLGPAGVYYARWRDGRFMSWASKEINDKIRSAESDGSHVKAIALGYGGSYVISFGSRTNTGWTGLGTKWSLKGYYPGLQQFLGDHIRAISYRTRHVQSD
ncbi:hypothetical protein BJX64DRAFT_290654 [Aspergillus heterothallicus]